MKKRWILTAMIMTLGLVGCQKSAPVTGSLSEEETMTETISETASEVTSVVEIESEAVSEEEGTLYVDFTDGKPANFHMADGWCNGSMFNVTWRKRMLPLMMGKCN